MDEWQVGNQQGMRILLLFSMFDFFQLPLVTYPAIHVQTNMENKDTNSLPTGRIAQPKFV